MVAKTSYYVGVFVRIPLSQEANEEMSIILLCRMTMEGARLFELRESAVNWMLHLMKNQTALYCTSRFMTKIKTVERVAAVCIYQECINSVPTT